MIFGVSGSKFQVIGSTASVLLEHSIINPTWNDSRYLEDKSILNGVKTFRPLGNYSEFDVMVNLHKYTSSLDKFNEIYSCNHEDVYFYPHVTGNPIMETSIATASFHITDIQLSHLDVFNQFDILNIRFKSKNYTDSLYNVLTASVEAPYTGSGTEADPFLIYNALDLYNMPSKSANGIFALANDIDMSGYSNWFALSGFGGSLNGRNYKINNLTATNYNGKYNGLIGYYQPFSASCYIKNIIMDNCSINITGAVTMDNEPMFGLLIARIAAGTTPTIQNIHVKNSEIIFNPSSNNNYFPRIGGLVGYTQAGYITCCSVDSSTIYLNQPSLTSNTPYLSGLVGEMDIGVIVYSYVSNTSIYGNRNGNPCYVNGMVHSTRATNSTAWCYTKYVTVGTAGTNPFFDGFSYGATTDVACYSVATSSTPSTAFAPFTQDNNPAQCYYDFQYANKTFGYGTALSSSQMLISSSFAGSFWDFQNIWTQSAFVNDGLPYLRANVPA